MAEEGTPGWYPPLFSDIQSLSFKPEIEEMFGLKDTLKQGKDLALSRGLRLLVDKVLEPYGKTTGFRLDTRQKKLELTVQLKGETQPLQIMVCRYRIVSEGGARFVQADEIVTSREWLNTFLDRYGCGKRIEIPEQYAWIAEKLV